jgi:ABC-type sugar transport system permease subunit
MLVVSLAIHRRTLANTASREGERAQSLWEREEFYPILLSTFVLAFTLVAVSVKLFSLPLSLLMSVGIHSRGSFGIVFARLCIRRSECLTPPLHASN